MRTVLLAALVAISGCDDTLYGKPVGWTPGGTEGEGEGEGEGESGDDWCAVQSIFNNQCTACHTGASASGGLDLTDDPYDRIVGQPSSLYDGRTLVVPSDPASSFLYLKVTGAQAASEGMEMPPGSGLSAEKAATIAAWITAGATTDCTSTVDTGDTGGGGYHPPGFADPEVHGLEAKLQEQECVACHGADLSGSGEAVSCDTCHEEGWRTNCTFCHGGTETSTGAPPADIDGSTTGLSFPHHTTHVSDTAYKDGFDCVQCHQKPTDVLSVGHLFIDDETPAVAEVDFSDGLSDAGRWDGTETCTNLYCHGNGQGDNGTISVGADIDDCTSCHPHRASGEDAWKRMSGEHEEHIDEGLACGNCHGATVSDWDDITDTSKHVNGTADVQLVTGMTWSSSAETCTGTCHGEYHGGRHWNGGDDDDD